METRSKKINIIIKKSWKTKSQAINIVEFVRKAIISLLHPYLINKLKLHFKHITEV